MNNNYKIVLINPPISISEVYGKYSKLASFQPPIGLCSLAGHLIKHNYSEVKIIDACVLLLSIRDIVSSLSNTTPHLIGIYCNTSNYYIVMDLTKSLKLAFPTVKIVLGGPHPSVLPTDTLSDINADFAVIGEGEETLLELVNYLNDGAKDFSDIKGLTYRNADNIIQINELRPRINNLDNLAFPAISLLPDITKYNLYLMQYKRSPYMTLITSRGCPFNCVFCETPFGKRVRYHSPDYVTEYISYLNKDFGVKELHFCDDTFTLDEDRTFEICNQILKKELDISWYAATRANLKNKGLFKEMKKAGCWICAIGAESGNENIIKLIGKNITLNEIKETCKCVRDAKLQLKVFFILGNPGETIETMNQTIELAVSLKAHFPVFSLMTPYPGTQLWKNAEKFGKLKTRDFRRLHISSSDPVFIPNGLTKEIIAKKQSEAFKKTYLTPGMFCRQLSSLNSISDINKLTQAFIAFLKLKF